MEVWKDIAGYEGFYQVSTLGRVKSVTRVVKRAHSKDGSIHNRTYYGGLISQKTTENGYKSIVLQKNCIRKSVLVHRLVAMTFIPNPENKPQVNHKNATKSDNRLENLEWCTNRENINHAMNNGLTLRGSRIGNSKLNEFKVRVIRKCNDLNNRELSEYFNVHTSTINLIINFKTWN